MENPSTAGKPVVNSVSHRTGHTRLHGRWLLLARILWACIAAIAIGSFIIAGAQSISHLKETSSFFQTYLLHPDHSLSGYIVFDARAVSLVNGSTLGLMSVFATISSIFWISIGLILFSRKSDDWLTLLVSMGLITLAVAFSPQFSFAYFLAGQHSPWRLLFPIINVLGWSSIDLFFYLFPTGRFAPRWIAWSALVYLIFELSESLPSNSPISIVQLPPLLQGLILLILALCPMYTQVYRYRHLSSLVERQQVKWVVFGIMLSLLTAAILFLPQLLFPALARPGSARSIYAFSSASVYLLVLNMLPLTIGFAVSRYRLWDIDVIINRTLVYATLTATLAFLYFGSIIGLQTLLRGFTGGSQFVLVCSTLAMAALFQPLRKRIQIGIDRRFYRRKYDVARTLELFNATLRHEVDLNQLSEALLSIIQETMQPTHISLWLRPTTPDNT
jgi:MFS family permease